MLGFRSNGMLLLWDLDLQELLVCIEVLIFERI